MKSITIYADRLHNASFQVSPEEIQRVIKEHPELVEKKKVIKHKLQLEFEGRCESIDLYGASFGVLEINIQ